METRERGPLALPRGQAPGGHGAGENGGSRGHLASGFLHAPRCSTSWAPWFIIPADHKWVRNSAVSEIIVRALESLSLRYPPPALDLSPVEQLAKNPSQEESAGVLFIG